MRGIICNVEPLSPRFLTYRGVKIIGGNGVFALTDRDVAFACLDQIVDYIDLMDLGKVEDD